ncbi:hypothetical protein DXG01_014923 [Tephrocybe rancida]|nr:hypothetical protein DXG01_014923 [Tephrocybe rancida]
MLNMDRFIPIIDQYVELETPGPKQAYVPQRKRKPQRLSIEEEEEQVPKKRVSLVPPECQAAMEVGGSHSQLSKMIVGEADDTDEEHISPGCTEPIGSEPQLAPTITYSDRNSRRAGARSPLNEDPHAFQATLVEAPCQSQGSLCSYHIPSLPSHQLYEPYDAPRARASGDKVRQPSRSFPDHATATQRGGTPTITRSGAPVPNVARRSKAHSTALVRPEPPCRNNGLKTWCLNPTSSALRWQKMLPQPQGGEANENDEQDEATGANSSEEEQEVEELLVHTPSQQSAQIYGGIIQSLDVNSKYAPPLRSWLPSAEMFDISPADKLKQFQEASNSQPRRPDSRGKRVLPQLQEGPATKIVDCNERAAHLSKGEEDIDELFVRNISGQSPVNSLIGDTISVELDVSSNLGALEALQLRRPLFRCPFPPADFDISPVDMLKWFQEASKGGAYSSSTQASTGAGLLPSKKSTHPQDLDSSRRVRPNSVMPRQDGLHGTIPSKQQ